MQLRKDLKSDSRKITFTNKNGEFVFQAVPEGTYYVDVDAPGVLSLTSGFSFSNFGYSFDGSVLRQITVDGLKDIKTEIRVERGATINGRISYADGEPATLARIVLYKQKGDSFAPLFVGGPDSIIHTDDRGAYRVEGLPPGKYLVGAVENHSGADGVRRDETLVTAYHPAATDARHAEVISVEPGSEVLDVDIKFDQPQLQLFGTLTWKKDDQPVKGAAILLRRKNDPQMDLNRAQLVRALTPDDLDLDNLGAMMREVFFFSLTNMNSPRIEINENGRWGFTDLSPGTYQILVTAPLRKSDTAQPKKDPKEIGGFGSPPSDFDNGAVSASVEVTLEEENVDDFSIKLSEGASVSGTVTIEGVDPEVRPVWLTAVNSNVKSVVDFPERVNKDGTFSFRSVPAGLLRFDITDSIHYYIRSMTGRGRDLLSDPLPVEDGEQVTGIRIVLGRDLARVAGQVVAAGAGPGAGGASVVFFPVDKEKWELRSAVALERADAAGRFSLILPPGEYFALAWSIADEPTVPVQSYVLQHIATARKILLQPGENRPLEIPITIDPKETPQP